MMNMKVTMMTRLMWMTTCCSKKESQVRQQERRGVASSKCRENQPRQSKGKSTKSEPKKWSSKETNQLIDLFEERPCLWDVLNKSYHDREKRDKAYVEI